MANARGNQGIGKEAGRTTLEYAFRLVGAIAVMPVLAACCGGRQRNHPATAGRHGGGGSVTVRSSRYRGTVVQ